VFRYPLEIKAVSPRNLWIEDASGECVAVAERKAGALRDPGATIRIRGCEGGRPASEILRVEDEGPRSVADGSKEVAKENLPHERLSADVLKRRYDGPGVPGANRRPLHHSVYGSDGRCLGMVGVRSHWEGIWEIADASGRVIGRVLKERMFSRECNVELHGEGAMSLRRRGLFSGGLQLARSEVVTTSEDEEKLLLAGVIFVLLEGADG
jgi:hypothetical protein